VGNTIAEPVAAALSYVWSRGIDATVVVYDFGGGTFDTSVIRVSNDTYEVFAKLGNPDLGGHRIDTIIYDEFLRPPAEELTGFQLSLDGDVVHQQADEGENRGKLFQAAEETKIALSSSTSYDDTVTLRKDDGEQVKFEFSVSRDQFEEKIRHHITGTIETVRDVIDEAGMRPDDVDHFLVVGGVSRMPMIRDGLRGMAGEDRFRVPSDPDLAVVEGTALYASDELDLNITVRDVLARDLRMRIPRSARTRVIIPARTPTESAENTVAFKWPGPETKRISVELCEGPEDDFAKNQPVGTLVIELGEEQKLDKNARVDVTIRCKPDSNSYSAEAKMHGSGAPVHAEINEQIDQDTHTQSADVVHTTRSDIILCLDVSRSFQNGALVDAASECLRIEEALRANGVDVRFGVVAFSDHQMPEEAIAAHDLSRLDGALQRRLDSLPSYDGGDDREDVEAGLQRALTMLSSSYPEASKHVLLFTDAQPKDEETLSALSNRFADFGATVLVFGPTKPYNEAYRLLAERTGGEYFDVHTQLHDGVESLLRQFVAED